MDEDFTYPSEAEDGSAVETVRRIGTAVVDLVSLGG